MTAGGCNCSAATYRVTGPLRPVIDCHCLQCRKTSGFHVAATSAQRDHVDITGTLTWHASSDAAKRAFCGTCGSNLFWDGAGCTSVDLRRHT
jgi:hypothetical protein